MPTPVEAQRTIETPNSEETGRFGREVASIGDVDGDGTPDTAIGAPFETVSGQSEAGRVYLLSGADGSSIRTLTSPNAEAGGHFGFAIAEAGDVNGDGTPDAIVSAETETVNGKEGAGRAYLVSGADGSVLQTLTSPNAQESGIFGIAVAHVGDIGNDGIPDVIVGAQYESVGGTTAAGRAYLLGTDGNLLQELPSPNPESHADYATAVAGVDDIDDDGTPDVVVGASLETVDEATAAGRAYVFSGADGSVIHTLTSPAPNGGAFGVDVARVGDLDGDGTADLAVGASAESISGTSGAGRVYLISGASGSVVRTLTAPNVEFLGGFGGQVAGAGRVDGDPAPDVLVGASGAGRTYVLSGADGSAIGTLNSAHPNNERSFGFSIASAGDVDDDGTPDVLVGDPFETVGGQTEVGRAYLFRSAMGELPVELTSFEATAADEAVRLTWQTASEANNAGFDVERKPQGAEAWTKVGFVEGRGTTTAPHRYSFRDANLPYETGTFTYRLKQIDTDGTTHLHDPVTVELAMNRAVHLSAPVPNPASGTARLTFTVKQRAQTTVSLYNMLGRKVTTLYRGTPRPGERQTLRLDTRDLSSGVYVVRLRAEGRTETQRITVVR